MPKTYFVYVMSNHSRMLYIGVTNNLERRVREHKEKTLDGYTRRYNLTRLVYYEESNDVVAALAREKQIRGWRRTRKLALVASMNYRWRDLAEDWE